MTYDPKFDAMLAALRLRPRTAEEALAAAHEAQQPKPEHEPQHPMIAAGIGNLLIREATADEIAAEAERAAQEIAEAERARDQMLSELLAAGLDRALFGFDLDPNEAPMT